MYVTVREAAQLTGLSERTIRRRIAAERIRTRRSASNRLEVERDDVPPTPGATMWSLLLDSMRDLAKRVERLEQAQVDKATREQLKTRHQATPNRILH